MATSTADRNRGVAFAATLLAVFVLAYVGGWLASPLFGEPEPAAPHDRMEAPAHD